MRTLLLNGLFLIPILLWTASSGADPTPASWDEDRLSGFSEHLREGKIYDREREKGRTAYIEDEEQWQQGRRSAREEYKLQAKARKMADGGPEDKADQIAKAAAKKEREELRLKYIHDKEAMLHRRRTNLALVTPEEELGLKTNRPRYDNKKRVLYGAENRLTKKSSSGFGGGGPSLPPPPSNGFSTGMGAPNVNDGSANNSYIPPPNLPDYDDLPPPPPPMSPPFDDGSGNLGNGDFSNPPPPDFNDFPPPPPPMENF